MEYVELEMVPRDDTATYEIGFTIYIILYMHTTMLFHDILKGVTLQFQV
jgi:hypothetical protein